MSEEQYRFNQATLTLPYGHWRESLKLIRDKLADNDKRWLAQWEQWDLACSPMDDNERRYIRYGHFLGWRANEVKL